jgi:hypothetical protein
MIREKKIYCGDFLEVDIYPYTETPGKRNKKRKRAKKKKLSPPKQRNLNDKNSRRYLIQLINANFGSRDYKVEATYNSENHPETVEEAEREVDNFFSRINYKRKKKGLKPARRVCINESSVYKDTGKLKHMHHHIYLEGGLTRDEVESCWSRPKNKGQEVGDKIGRINANWLQPDENGLAGIATYTSKDTKAGKKKWSSSHNLIKPEQATPVDGRYSKRQVEKIAKGEVDIDYINKKYPGWKITDKDYGIRVEYNEHTNHYYIYLRLRRERKDST